MVNDILIFTVSLFALIKGATLATRYASRLAAHFNLSKYAVGFIIVAIISILPETFVAVSSALKGQSAFGLGMLFGSNIADLTLVFAVIILLTGRQMKIEGKILKNHVIYPFVLMLPLVLGLDGAYSRFEGAALIIGGGLFYFYALKDGFAGPKKKYTGNGKYRSMVKLVLCLALMLIGAHLTVDSAASIAAALSVSPILIGMLVVGLGTTMPELLFSLKSVEEKEDSLAVGDVLGTVLADATIVVGILALINPFAFPVKIIYITGVFMVAAAVILFHFMRTGRALTKQEVRWLLAFWLLFVAVELIANNWSAY